MGQATLLCSLGWLRARMLHLRALRLLQGLPSLPAASTTQVSTFGAALHSIPAIVAQLP